MTMKKYLLLDANVVAGYYLPRSSNSLIHERMTQLVNMLKKRGRTPKPFVLFLPNFCIVEVFNIFRKYRFGKWNRKVISNGGTITKQEYDRVYRQFQKDIHNGKLFYHYELSRYHLLNTALIGPIDNYYAYQRQRGKKKANPSPMSTFDSLIIGIGIELVRLHGQENVLLLTDDDRIYQMLQRASTIPKKTARKLGLYEAASLIGKQFARSLYPKALHLRKASQREYVAALGFTEAEWNPAKQMADREVY
jgi:hypothetical protein